MIDRFLALLGNYPANILPRWSSLDQDLSVRYAFLRARFGNMTLPDSSNVLLVKHILMQLSEIINELAHYPSMMDRVSRLMMPDVRLKLEQRIDGLRTTTDWSGTFVRNSQKKTNELIIPVSYHRDPFMYYPTMPSEEYKWEQVRPLRLVYHDSPELVLDLIGSPKLRFKKYQPSIAVFTLNMTSLVLKYLWYNERCKRESIVPDVKEFIRDDVFAFLFKDLRDVWVLNLLDHIFSCEDVTDFYDLNTEFSKNEYALSDHGQYLKELFKYSEFVKRGSVDPRFMLNTKLFATQSLVQKLEEFRDEQRTWHLRQYKHYELSVYLPYIRIMLTKIGRASCRERV
jgi:hypothetical protein